MSEIRDVSDWASDWDHHHPEWVNDPFPIWADLRDRCPMAHTDRYNEGVWLPTRYEDVMAIAHDTTTFSSAHDGAAAGGTVPRPKSPPIHLDPPHHLSMRRALLPFFNPKRVLEWEPSIRAHCEDLAQSLAGKDHVDIASEYAAHIPASAMAMILGIPASVGEKFRTWMHLIELGDNEPDLRDRSIAEMRQYFADQIADRRENPGTDLISYLVNVKIEGELIDDPTLEMILALQLVAGIDTTWGVIGASLWHLASHPDDRRRLVAEPGLLPTAMEELLRAYASVSLWRTVTTATSIGGTEISPGDTVMMTFPAACRDPEMFERADEVLIDRQANRHVAFGAGIHRCLGSNLARLELRIALETWLKYIPDFELEAGADVTWAEGALRGPRSVPIVIRH